MPTVFIFHGILGDSQENWFPWLKGELESRGYEVVLPDFPDSDHPRLNKWLDHFSNYQYKVASDSIFVGHSLGSSLVMRLLERLSEPIGKTILAASVFDVMNNEFDPEMATFVEGSFNWELVKKNAGDLTLFHGDDDPYITLEKAQEFASSLQTELRVIPGAGHINKSAGYAQFPQILDLF